MKTSLTILSFILLFHSHFVLRGQTENIALDNVFVTFGMRGDLKDCIRLIEKHSDLMFTFQYDQVKKVDSLDLPYGTRNVKDLLDLVLQGTPLAYRQVNERMVVVFRGDKPEPTVEEQAILVKGRVTTQEGGDISDVNVLVKDQNVGTRTKDGTFQIYVLRNSVLTFSHVSYKATEAVADSEVVNVVMQSQEGVLREVEINAGYWQVKDIAHTGNISRLNAKDIETLSVSSPLQLLSGRMPGVYVQQNSGVAGGAMSLQIRGKNSLRDEGNYPLFLVDGIPFPASPISSSLISENIIRNGNPFVHINPSDIESIDILKDADATAIYGLRGANGVVLISMKKAKKDRNKVGLHFSQGIGQVTRTMQLLDTKEWLEMRKEAFANDGAKMTIGNARDLLVWDTTRYTDWQKELIGGMANITDVRGSLSGGDENKQFYFGTSYYRETPPFPGDFAFQRGSWYFNFNNMEPQRRLVFNFTASHILTDNELPRADPTEISRKLSPVAPAPFTENGDLNFETGFVNPMAQLLQTYNGKTNNTLANASLKYSITPQLELKSNIGFSGLRTNEWQKIPKSSLAPAFNETNRSIYGTHDISTVIVEPQLFYNLKNVKRELQFFGGVTYQQTVSERKSLLGVGFISDEMLENLTSALEIDMLEDTRVPYKYNSLFSRLNYNYSGKYFFNLTGRRDRSTKLSPGKRVGNFGAIGTAWIFTKERFFGNAASWFSFGKIRASYGITGNDLVGDYQYINKYSYTSSTYNGHNGTISYETNRKAEIACDLGVFNNRILLSSCYYFNRSSDLVSTVPSPLITGQSTIEANTAAVAKNTGFEFMLTTIIAARQGHSWHSSLNVTIPQNKLAAYSDLQALLIPNNYRYTGLNSEGVYTFHDVNGDGQISWPLDIKPGKRIGQSMYGGIQNTIQFGRLELDILLQFVKQTSYNYLALFSPDAPGSRLSNQPAFVMNRWRQAGDASDVQRFTTLFLGKPATAYRDLAVSDQAISNASFMRVKDITLSWHSLNACALASIKVYIQGHNLFTFTKYKGYDPESLATGSLPPLRSISCGLKMTL